MSPAGSSNAPEARARQRIDQALTDAGWTLQDRDDMNLAAAASIAVREFKLDKGHGDVDYMLFLDWHPVGVCEAKLISALASLCRNRPLKPTRSVFLSSRPSMR